MTTVDYNGQKKDENQSTVLDNININNRISDMNIISGENKNKSSIKSLIFVGIAISLIIISAIVLVIVLSNKKKKSIITLDIIIMTQVLFQMILIKEMKHQILMKPKVKKKIF